MVENDGNQNNNGNTTDILEKEGKKAKYTKLSFRVIMRCNLTMDSINREKKRYKFT